MFLTIKLSKVLSTLVFAILIISFVVLFVVSKTKATSGSVVKYTIAIDAGHGGIDGGTLGVNTKIKESDLNLKITKFLENYLKAFGFNVVLTRKDENGLYSPFAKDFKKDDMLKRQKIIENKNADMIVSIHMNSYVNKTQKGAQAFYYKGHDDSKALADCVQEQLFKNVPLARQNSNFGDYFMLNCANVPSIIVECGFLSNPENEELLIKESHQKLIAYNIFTGIVKFYTNIKQD